MKLISGREYLQKYPNFKLVSRDEDIERISSILCRKRNNSLIISGLSGVGLDSLIMGLELAKENGTASFDIKSKQFFWLDVDNLFSNGDSQEINKEFQDIIRTLERTPNSVLVIPNGYTFMEGAQSTGNNHFINTLNNADKAQSFQVIMEVFDDNLSSLYKLNNSIHNLYTLYDVKELNGDKLLNCLQFCAESLSNFHGIKINNEAVQEAVNLTQKYRDDYGLGLAQPKRTISLLDRALSSYKLKASKEHPEITKLKEKISECKDNNEKSNLEKILYDSEQDWNNLYNKINDLSKHQSQAEELRIKYTDDLNKALERQKESSEKLDDDIMTFASLTSSAGFESKEVVNIRKNLNTINTEIENLAIEYNKLKEKMFGNLVITKSDIIEEFSKISGISSAKLDENEMETLRNLEDNLKARIFGQDEAVRAVANGIKVARVDSMGDSGPAASYLFLGPSGVGKTEMCKALAQNLYGDDKALIRFDMSEYMEKHAVAKLIGAPPGYEGFECGGILTNTVRKNPIGIYLFDEIEKAHPDVFNIFLQILSDGRLTDNIGRTVDFSETIIIMTSNIGQTYYLDASISDDEAVEKANEELCKTYRSELLNRFNGRENILHFKRLTMNTIQKIVKREIDKINNVYTEKGLSINITNDDISNFCKDHYDVIRGARGLPGYIKANLRPIIVNHILEYPNDKGIFKVSYDNETQTFNVVFEKE